MYKSPLKGEINSYLPTLYQQFIYKSRYARWNDDLGRREEWPETVARYFNFFDSHLLKKYNYKIPAETLKWLQYLVLNLKIMPSMRAVMTAGEALKRENMAGFNCSYIPIDDPRSFDEVLYVLMNGTGVGFGVETSYIQKLPSVPEVLEDTDTVISVEDSKFGWGNALKELIALLYAGRIPKWDLSKLRPAGARLKTFGGRASGPEPLNELFNFVRNIFILAKGRKLHSIECHDIVCKIAESVIVGGVRRSALISLSDLNDDHMRVAKSGQWWHDNNQRALANNSAVYTETPSLGLFMKEWLSLYESKSGERGIFNRFAAINQINSVGRRQVETLGTNPCGEALLIPYQTCNLTEAIIRPEDTAKSIMEKIVAVSILGTWQSTLDNFNFIRPKWSLIEQQERLMGVSLSGIFDNPVFYTRGAETILQKGKQLAIETNAKLAEEIGINPSAGITLNKPSGTVSQLVNCASGMHTRHSQYYVRTVRGDNKDPLSLFLMEQGIPYEIDAANPKNSIVFSFPQIAPENSVKRKDISAIQHLEIYKMYKENWCEHNASVTISVKENEWLEVGAWVYKNLDSVIGLTFLPYSEHTYRQAPYQECDFEQYSEINKKMPIQLDWEKFSSFETEDNTTGSQELSCTSGVCDIA